MIAHKRIVITRAEDQAGELVERLRALGAEPSVCPTIALVPPVDTRQLDASLRQLASFDWLVFTSTNAVRFTWQRMKDLGIDPAPLQSLRIGAVGPATAKVLAEHGFQPTVVAPTARAEGLLTTIGEVEGNHILLPCADLARSELADGLTTKGALVSTVVAYRTVAGPGVDKIGRRLREKTIDALLFASPSALHYLLEGITAQDQRLLSDIALICIGPTTAAALRDARLPVAATAPEPTTEGVLAALIGVFK